MSFADEPVERFLERMRRLALEEEASNFSRHNQAEHTGAAVTGVTPDPPDNLSADIDDTQPPELAARYDIEYASGDLDDDSVTDAAPFRFVPDSVTRTLITKRIYLFPPPDGSLPALNSIFESERLLWWQVHELDAVSRRERIYIEKTTPPDQLEYKQAVVAQKFKRRLELAKTDSGLDGVNADAIVDLFGFLTVRGHETPPWNFPFYPRLCAKLTSVMSYDVFLSGKDAALGITPPTQSDANPVLHLTQNIGHGPDQHFEFEVRGAQPLPVGREIIGATVIQKSINVRRRTDAVTSRWVLTVQLARPMPLA